MTYTITDTQATVFILLVIWELIWKGLALWRAAKINQAISFVLLLILNTAGIFPIIYLLVTNSKVKH
jgi:Mg2+/Co2+ transporter CorB